MFTDPVETFEQEDIEKGKAMAGLAYLGILFFLPLVVCPESKYGKFHANQGLLLLILSIGSSVALTIIITILGWLPYIGWLLSALSSIIYLLLSLALLGLAIIGLINGFGGKAKELPIIGKYRLLK